MKRKVIKQANQAYTMTLPIEWVRENGIDKNSEIDLKISGKSIVINSDKPVVGDSVKINLDSVIDRNIFLHIFALYARGVDEIEITSDKDISPQIMRCMNSVIGYALVSHEENKYIIRDINPGHYPDLDDIFKRVFQMILLFYDAAIKDIFGEQKETLENLKARDNEVNKFCLYLQRAINKMSYDNPIKGRTVFTYSYALEKLGDEIERMWRTNIKHKIKKSAEIKELVDLSKKGVETAFDLYYRFNAKRVEKIYTIRERVRRKSFKIVKLDSNTTRFVRNVVKIVEEVADMNHLALMRKL